MKAMPNRGGDPLTVPTDRDAGLDRLLHALPAEDRGPTEDCLDAEAAAALVDGGLAPAQRTASMAHVATCGHCQALLAALGRTEPLAVPARAWWPVRPWPWLVPALATGLALTVWVAVERSGPRNPAVPVPAAMTDARRSATTADADATRPPVDSLARTAPGPLASTKAVSPRVGPPSDAFAAEMQNRTDIARTTAAPQPLSQAASDAAPREVAGVLPNGVRGQTSRAEVRRERSVAPGGAQAAAPASPPAANESVTLAAPATKVGGLAKAGAAPVAIDIMSSDPRIRWRIAGSTVEHSTDGGATWTPQAIGVSARLTAGSAPLPEVCWLVGDSGVVIVTADGLSWNRLPFPVLTPLASVSATGADTAAVTTADGRVFTTIDRGKTWRPR